VVFQRGERWRPFRSVASWYLWRACDLAKDTPPAGRSVRD
jgi:DNA-3-methyladenine glycosylase II